MEWTAGQKRALDLAGRWLRSSDDQCFVLGGYAGTGKTTLARRLADGHLGRVHFASYTGKAAHVLRRTGVEATTIHKLIYLPRDRCDQRLRQLLVELKILDRGPKTAQLDSDRSRVLAEVVKERENLRRPDFTLNTASPLDEDSLVVVDEYSMVDEQVGRDLLSFGCRVLALGDPGQLPPVQGRRFFCEPDYVLTEVVRQAAESPVVELATRVRAGKDLEPGTYGESRVVPRREVPDDEFDRMLAGADQVLVGLNTTRRRVNQRVRRVLGMAGDQPLPGDKLVCLRNSSDEGLFNGQTWRVARISGKGFFKLSLEGDGGEKVTCLAHPECFRGRDADLDPAHRRRANEFDYGYALTVHKSQGSEWDHVLVLDEWPGQDRAKWLYTALTRASERVTVIC